MLAGSHLTDPVNHLPVLRIYLLARPLPILLELPLEALDPQALLLDLINFRGQSIPRAEQLIPLVLHRSLLLSDSVLPCLELLLLEMQGLFELVKLHLPVSQQGVLLGLKSLMDRLHLRIQLRLLQL
jgi:hypothetical protein